jgi:SHS2 domain-containing protein
MGGNERESVRWLEHDADVLLEVRAPSRERLFILAAEALVDLMLENERPLATEGRIVRLSADSPGDLLVAWLNEMVYLVAGHVFFPAAVRALSLSEAALEAKLAGVAGGPAFPRLAREVKAATFHDLELARAGDAWRARVLFDV